MIGMCPHAVQKEDGQTPAGFLNLLLSSLDPAGRTRFFPHMRRIELKSRQILYRADQRISEIYFPENCVIAMLTVMRDGATIESATAGREGASWISASFKSPTMPCQTVVAIPGYAHVVDAKMVEREIRENGNFHDVLSHYSHTLLVQTLRSAACNALHTMEQRCSRWMLMTLDRIDISRFVITHDFLAALLGVQRSGISQLVERLASHGVVKSGRGEIRVADRDKLEGLSCECYALMKAQLTK
jgi:CRP-like cAMP-binding protein